jgi:hypothetical protein
MITIKAISTRINLFSEWRRRRCRSLLPLNSRVPGRWPSRERGRGRMSRTCRIPVRAERLGPSLATNDDIRKSHRLRAVGKSQGRSEWLTWLPPKHAHPVHFLPHVVRNNYSTSLGIYLQAEVRPDLPASRPQTVPDPVEKPSGRNTCGGGPGGAPEPSFVAAAWIGG